VGTPGLSRPWLARMHDVLSGRLERGAQTGAGGLVSTLQDYFAFADLRNSGRHGGGRLLSRTSVELRGAA
jgi:hypothetical protein